MLLSTTELASRLQDPGWVIFDCRHDLADKSKGTRVYGEGHIPGAHFARIETDLAGPKTGRNGRHPLPSPESFLHFLASHGVNASTQVVAYDDAGGSSAARLWWMLRWVGLAPGFLLDGGISRWRSEGRELSTATPTPKATELTGEADSTLLWNTEEVRRRLARGEGCLVDARAPERYRGEIEPIDPVAGHVPGALNRFFKDNLNSDLTFRSREELRKEFISLTGGWSPRNVAHQCGSGVTACLNIFAMEYAGLTGSKLYPGSWSEWVADPARPVARGPQP